MDPTNITSTLYKHIGVGLLVLFPSIVWGSYFQSVEDETLHKVPRRISNPSSDPENELEGCKDLGKTIPLKRHDKKLWFTANTCGGSGGQHYQLILESRKRVEIVLTGFGSGIEIQESTSHGLPDLKTVSSEWGDIVWQVYRYDGEKYVGYESATTYSSRSKFEEASPKIKALFPNLSKESGCFTAASFDDPTTLVYYNCTKDRALMWVVNVQSAPRIILEYSTPIIRPNNDPQFYPSFTVGPSGPHGFADICIEYSHKGATCWRYDGYTYQPVPKPKWYLDNN